MGSDWPSAALPPPSPDYVWDTALLWGKSCCLSDLGAGRAVFISTIFKTVKACDRRWRELFEDPLVRLALSVSGGVTASWWAPLRGCFDGENQASFQRASDSGTFLPLHSQSQIPAWVQPERSERKGQRGSSFNPLALLVGAHSPGSPALCSSRPAASLTTCLGIFIAAHRGIAAWLECGRSWACGRRQTYVLAPGWECRLSGPWPAHQ